MVVSPEERTGRLHLGSGQFLAGVAAGRWRLISLTWPKTLIAISAAERPRSPREFFIRFDLTGYPQTAPTGGLWDVEADASLAPELRPKGPRAAQLFRTDGWAGGATAMYAPWDRIALGSHTDWATKYPLQAWKPTRELSFALSQIHEVLNASDYLGV